MSFDVDVDVFLFGFQGGYSGNAAGFKLSSLLKLTDVSAHKPRMNLLHFVAQQLEAKNASLLQVGDEFEFLNEAASHSVETITTEVTHLKDGVNSVAAQIEKVDDVSFRAQVEDFLEKAKRDLEEFDRDLEQMEETRESLALYFCEDPKSFKLEECLAVFKTFFLKFAKAVKENAERAAAEEKAEMRRRQREEQQGVPGSSVASVKRRQTSGE